MSHQLIRLVPNTGPLATRRVGVEIGSESVPNILIKPRGQLLPVSTLTTALLFADVRGRYRRRCVVRVNAVDRVDQVRVFLSVVLTPLTSQHCERQALFRGSPARRALDSRSAQPGACLAATGHDEQECETARGGVVGVRAAANGRCRQMKLGRRDSFGSFPAPAPPSRESLPTPRPHSAP